MFFRLFYAFTYDFIIILKMHNYFHPVCVLGCYDTCFDPGKGIELMTIEYNLLFNS